MFYLLNTKSIIIHYLILYIQARPGAPCTVGTALSLSLDLSTFAQLSARLRLRNAVHEVKCVRGGGEQWGGPYKLQMTLQSSNKNNCTDRERGIWREGDAFVHVTGRTVGISRKQASKRALRRRRCVVGVVGVAASARCASDWAYLSGALHCELWMKMNGNHDSGSFGAASCELRLWQRLAHKWFGIVCIFMLILTHTHTHMCISISVYFLCKVTVN